MEHAGEFHRKISNGKTGLPFQKFHFFRKFSSGTNRKIMFHLQPNRNFRNLMVNGKHPIISVVFPYLSTSGVPKSGDVSKSSRCKNAFYDNVRILSENHPKAFRMFPMCFTTMSECSPRIPRRLSEGHLKTLFVMNRNPCWQLAGNPR